MEFRENHIKFTELHDFRAARGTLSDYQGNDRLHSLLGSLHFRKKRYFHEILIIFIRNWNSQENRFLHKTWNFTENGGISWFRDIGPLKTSLFPREYC